MGPPHCGQRQSGAAAVAVATPVWPVGDDKGGAASSTCRHSGNRVARRRLARRSRVADDSVRSGYPLRIAKKLSRFLGPLQELPYVVREIDLLAEFGYMLRRPHCDLLEDDIYELRIPIKNLQYRILYFYFLFSKTPSER